MKNTTIAIPYAGITQVRFKGYLLSLISAPLALMAFSLPQSFSEIKSISSQPEQRLSQV
jgi:hypothetical protein